MEIIVLDYLLLCQEGVVLIRVQIYIYVGAMGTRSYSQCDVILQCIITILLHGMYSTLGSVWRWDFGEYVKMGLWGVCGDGTLVSVW